MATDLQKAQQAWAWRRAELLSAEGAIKRVAHSIPCNSTLFGDFNDLIEQLHNANDAKFRALGGHPKKKGGENQNG